MSSSTTVPTQNRSAKRGCVRGLGVLLGLTILGGCKASQFEAPVIVAQDAGRASPTSEDARMWMTVGERRFAIALADTAAARAFVDRLPLTLDMAELNGNEKHADLPQALPTHAERPGTIQKGDLMLYGSSTVVVFYKTFRSSYSYTRLGRVEDPNGLSQVLGTRNSRVVFSAN
jgi:hypothetical protein